MGSISAMNDVCDDKIGRTPGAEGGGRRATVLAIGTANPANVVRQDEFPDYYFRVSKSEHLTNLKDKLRILCQKSGIRKRFLHMNEEMISAHPDFNDKDQPSLEARTKITATEVPKLAASAAAKAIAQWGRPAIDITHIVFSTYSGTSAPSADLRLASLLGLRPSVCRTTLNLHGCAGGGKALHLAKDIAENNHGARVLVACSEISLIAYSGPREGCVDSILGPALFGDGAGAVILGAGPFTGAERPIFEMVSASQTTIPGSESALTMQFRGGGMDYHVGKQVPMLLHHNIGQCLRDAVGQLGIQLPWNDLFWAVHPGGRAILDCVELVFGLEPEKLAASRHVLSEYGNMSSATVVFVLDEMRRRFGGEKKKGGQQEEVGDDEWGVMIAIGPGVTIETIVLRRATTTTSDV